MGSTDTEDQVRTIDAGTPPELEVTGPEGTTATGFDWPAPERIPFGPLVNYGYENQENDNLLKKSKNRM